MICTGLEELCSLRVLPVNIVYFRAYFKFEYYVDTLRDASVHRQNQRVAYLLTYLLVKYFDQLDATDRCVDAHPAVWHVEPTSVKPQTPSVVLTTLRPSPTRFFIETELAALTRRVRPISTDAKYFSTRLQRLQATWLRNIRCCWALTRFRSAVAGRLSI